MDWLKTSIKLTLKNENKYAKKIIGRNFTNIIADPKPEQIQLFAEAIEMLSDGDEFLDAEVHTNNRYVNEK